MIFRRAIANLRAQNWPAIAIEFAIVVAGVFVGMQVSNWNEARIDKAETIQVLRGLKPELNNLIGNFQTLRSYYGVTRAYAGTAFAGWRGEPGVNDRDFVIAAYQASQITAYGNNANVFGAIFGAENLREIEDPEIRQNLAIVMTYDYALVDLRAVSTRYREEVRKTIPHAIQQTIRERCGDRQTRTGFFLPNSCDIDLPPLEVAKTAAKLRARPELLGELHWHRAAVANQMTNASVLASFIRPLVQRIDVAESRRE